MRRSSVFLRRLTGMVTRPVSDVPVPGQYGAGVSSSCRSEQAPWPVRFWPTPTEPILSNAAVHTAMVCTTEDGVGPVQKQRSYHVTSQVTERAGEGRLGHRVRHGVVRWVLAAMYTARLLSLLASSTPRSNCAAASQARTACPFSAANFSATL